MKKFLKVLSVSFLFTFPLLSLALGEEPNSVPPSPWMGMFDAAVAQRANQPQPPQPPQPPQGRANQPLQQSENQRSEAIREFQRAIRNLQLIVQEARSEGNPLAQKLQDAVQDVLRVAETIPNIQAATPAPNADRNALNVERDVAYATLARQYFQLLCIPSDLPPNALPPGVTHLTGEARDKVRENFLACMKKISPASQIRLINELGQKVLAYAELKMLEDLLDNVLMQPPQRGNPAQPPAQPRRANVNPATL